MEEVELSIQGEVALLQLRRPTHGNALRGTMFDALRRIAVRLSDAPPGFLVLVGEGPDFCTGLDLDPSDALWALFEPMARARDAHRAQELVTRIRIAFDAIARLPCPVLAAIEGQCHGAGAELALLADIRVLGATATFALGEGRNGIVTGFGGLVRAAMLLGPTRAGELALLGDPISADHALQLGLAARIVDDGSALSGALEVVQDLRRTSPVARLQTMLALRTIANRQSQNLFEAEIQAAARTWIATDWQVALQARRDGGEPRW